MAGRALFPRVLFTLLALSSAGCLSISSVQRAETLGEGKWQVGVEPAVAAVGRLAGGGEIGPGALPYPRMEVSGRVGVADRLDLGGRLGVGLNSFSFLTTSAEFGFKWQMTSRDERRVIASVAPSASLAKGLTGETGTYGAVTLRVLIGIPTQKEQELVLGPRVRTLLARGEVPITSIGGSLGYAFPITERVQLMPEVGLITSVRPALEQIEGQFTLGVLFGG